jgi:uncharacterized protein
MSQRVELYFQTARESLADAEFLLSGRRYAAVLSRAYYAVFYAASAMLLQAGLKVESHYGVKTKFSELFVRSGRVEVRFSKILTTSFQQRQDADYSPETRAAVTKEDAELALRRAEEFVKMAEKFLEGTGGSIE